METIILKKEYSFSQYRKKKSLSKINLNQSMTILPRLQTLNAEDKTSELLSMEKQLNSIVKNRSMSAHTGNNEQIQRFKSHNKVGPTTNTLFHTGNQSNQKSARLIQFQSLNQIFQAIEETSVHNEQDNAFTGLKQITKKSTSKINFETEKNINKKKNVDRFIQPLKNQKKASIKDLDEMQKHLQSARNKTKLDLKQKKPNKLQMMVKTHQQKNQRKIQKCPSQIFMFSETKKIKNFNTIKEKDSQPKLVKKKLESAQKEKQQIVQKSICDLIPTKMLHNEEKQKLILEFDVLKIIIKNTEICADNVVEIRKLLKRIKTLLN